MNESSRARLASPVLLALSLTLGAMGVSCKKLSSLVSGDSEGKGGKGESSSGAKELAIKPSNVSLSGIDLHAIGDFVVDKDCNLLSDQDLNACGTATAFATVKQSDGTKIGVYVARSFRIGPNAVLTLSGLNPVALVALDKIEVLGGIVSEGPPGQKQVRQKGAGPGGGGAGSDTHGAGGGSFCGVGGKGPLELKLPGAPGAGGAVYGSPALIPLVAGSQGGGGEPGAGGLGGGAIQLVAGKSITVKAKGYIQASGLGGEFGGVAGTHQNGSGGGSGGAILIEAPDVTIAGILAANGGGGGTGSTAESGANGSNDDKPARGGRDPDGNSGGNGSAGAKVNGDDGLAKAAASAAGGGGGAGRIRINTQSGKATISGTLSPSAATPCFTQGLLTR